MHEVRADLSKNLLWIQLKGYFTDDKAREVVDLILKEAGRLRPGFTVINDISEMAPLSKTGMKEIERAQTGIRKLGARKSIRVVGNVLSGYQIHQIQKTSGADYQVIKVANLEEAMKLV
jgi:hypothetical protein